MVIDKQTRIQSHFQKIDNLGVSNKIYQKCVDDLCQWLLKYDRVQDDLTTKLLFLKEPKEISAKIISKQPMTIAGIAEAGYLLNTFTEINFSYNLFDGMQIGNNETVFELHGTAAEILAYERTLLNILQRLSGIATTTNIIVDQIKALHVSNSPLIVATRKTPWTLLDKKAVALGGGGTHRLNLSDGVLVKDNHLLILKEIYGLDKEPQLAVKTFEILVKSKKNILIEIEVEKRESIEALIKAANASEHTNTLCIMMDNFTPSEAKKTLDDFRRTYDLSQIIFEASGNINQHNINEWAAVGVDILSLGALTHSTQAADLSLEIV